MPQDAVDASHVWHLIVIRHANRDQLQKYLTSKGIGTLIHFPIPPHLSDAYKDLGYQENAFPIAELIAKTVLSIPIGPHFDIDDAAFVVENIKEFCAKV